jgi:DNA-directed RNA polymerase subunit N (RpoN/RPB10)
MMVRCGRDMSHVWKKYKQQLKRIVVVDGLYTKYDITGWATDSIVK